MIETNAIAFVQDLKSREWTFGYYLNNALYRLDFAYKRICPDSEHAAVVSGYLANQGDAIDFFANVTDTEKLKNSWSESLTAAEALLQVLLKS